MLVYEFCNSSLESDIPFQLHSFLGVEAEYTFHFNRTKHPENISGCWFHEYSSSIGEIWLTLGKCQAGYVFQFPELADFLVSGDGRTISCHSPSTTSMETIKHLFLDHVLPTTLSHRGRMVIHASAVLTPEGAIAFIGDSGWGKSTLVAGFCEQGLPLLTDDCLVLEAEDGVVFGFPSYPILRLWPDVASAVFKEAYRAPQSCNYLKERLCMDGTRHALCNERVPIRKFYLLASPQEREKQRTIAFNPVSPRELLMELISHSFRLDITDLKRAKKEFGRLGGVATSIPASHLTFPQDLSFLPKLYEAVLADLDKTISPSSLFQTQGTYA